MKKSLITIALLTASVGTAHAFSPALDGQWNGELEFNGVIIDETPVWEFEVPSETEQLAANLDVNIYGAIEDEDNYIWDLNQMDDVVILSGQTIAAIAQGAPDLAPVITMGLENTLIDGSDDAPTKVEIEAAGSGDEVGTLTLNLKRADAIGYFDGTTGYITANNGEVALASATLSTVVTYGNDEGTQWASAIPGSGSDVFAEMLKDTNQEIFAATDVLSDSTSLAFAKDSTPDVWSATLPITVTIQ